jgi:hypothetical protein
MPKLKHTWILLIGQRHVDTRNKTKRVYLTFLSISLLAMAVLDATPNALGQAATSPVEKKDIFKVIMTVQGLNQNTGDIVTIVSVNGESRVKLFDD